MRRAVRTRRIALLAMVVALAVAAAGCAGKDDTPTEVSEATGVASGVTGTSVAAPTTTERPRETSTTVPPVRGGSLTIGVLPRPVVLDPVAATGDGTGGGTEMLAVYDSLFRFDPDTGTYQPRTAASLVPNADLTVWTLTLRSGIRFSDGTAYDADAVKFGLDRHRAGQPGAPACTELRACPSNRTASASAMSFVRDIEVTGPLTVVISLRAPWADFAWVLATEPGMIPSPTALRAACSAAPEATPEQCAFATAPVGAGPFTVTSTTGGTVTMARNRDYWGQLAPLDAVRFVPLADAGASRSLDQLTTGTVDAAMLVEPHAVTAAREKRFAGRGVTLYGGAAEIVNVAPLPQVATRYLRVRLAIAAALDPVAVNERVTGNRDLRAGELFAPGGNLAPAATARRYDPERARQLVTEAKANGWNGTVRYLCDNSANGQARGIAIETMLKAAGIDAVVDTSRDAAAVRAAVRDPASFDLVCGSLGHAADSATAQADGTTLAALTQQLATGGASNIGGWSDPRADAAIAALRSARTETERRAATRTLVDEIGRDVPVVVTGGVEHYLAWATRVHGIAGTTGSRVLLDQAWVGGTGSR